MTVIATPPGLDLVRLRPISIEAVEATFPIHPGERALVSEGESVLRGAHLAERLRDGRTDVIAGPSGGDTMPGAWWAGGSTRRGRGASAQGELLFRSGGQWRLATGDPSEPLEAPFDGVVGEVHPGSRVQLRSTARGLLGSDVLGGPSSGRLRLLAPRDGHVRTSEIDVASAGSILVVGSSIDAEAITRARAVGIRGLVVAGLGVKERRDAAASERRARTGVHGLAPFAILVLEGPMSRPIATPIMAILEVLEGRTVAIIGDPACLVFDLDGNLPTAALDLVRVTAGPLAGLEGRWGGLAGPHRFSGGVTLEAGWVRFGVRPAVALPLGDLERFA